VTVKHALSRVVAAVLVPSFLACSSWGPPLPLSRLTADGGPSRARVTLADGRQLVLEHPTVRGDTLFGDTLTWRNTDVRSVPHPVAVPVAGVRSVSTREFSIGRTTLVVVAVPVGVVALFAAWCSLSDCLQFSFAY
jgi:hypothetical protein